MRKLVSDTDRALSKLKLIICGYVRTVPVGAPAGPGDRPSLVSAAAAAAAVGAKTVKITSDRKLFRSDLA